MSSESYIINGVSFDNDIKSECSRFLKQSWPNSTTNWVYESTQSKNQLYVFIDTLFIFLLWTKC